MDRVFAESPPTTAHLTEALLGSVAARRRFVAEQIVCTRPAMYGPLELTEMRTDLGPVMLDVDVAPILAFHEGPDVIRAEVMFIDESEIEEKREAAYAWMKTIAARDVQPNVLVYRLNASRTDMASLSKVSPPWMPDEIACGDRINYEGRAYAQLGDRGAILQVSGEFEIVGIEHDDVLWFDVRGVGASESVFLTGPLLWTATFPSGRPRSSIAKPTVDESDGITLAEVAASADQETAWLYALYLRGDRSEAEDEPWLKEAAEMGIVPAIHSYAEFLEDHGRPREAEAWYEAAAEGGSAPALYEMGLIHDERSEFAEGEACYRQAAEQGFLPAMCDLGRRLAKRGDPEANVWLGMCSEAGYEPWDGTGSGRIRKR